MTDYPLVLKVSTLIQETQNAKCLSENTIAEDYGTLANHVPFGDGALAANGIDITVLSLTQNADALIAGEASSDDYAPTSFQWTRILKR